MSRYALKIVLEEPGCYAGYVERPGQTSAEYLPLPEATTSEEALTQGCQKLEISRETSRDARGLPWDLFNLA